MPIFTVDVTDAYEDLFGAGLALLIREHADASVTVDGLEAPAVGTLAHVGRDGRLVIDQHQDGDSVGTFVAVPLDRVICVRAAYRLVDAAADRRARVEADEAFLAHVLELARPLADHRRQVGTTIVAGATAGMLRDRLRDQFDHYPTDHIEEALQILEDRGELPRRGPV